MYYSGTCSWILLCSRSTGSLHAENGAPRRAARRFRAGDVGHAGSNSFEGKFESTGSGLQGIAKKHIESTLSPSEQASCSSFASNSRRSFLSPLSSAARRHVHVLPFSSRWRLQRAVRHVALPCGRIVSPVILERKTKEQMAWS